MSDIKSLINPTFDESVADNKIKLPAIDSLISPQIIMRVNQFHRSLPEYQPTPLIRLSNLAERIGLTDILVKDESQRFELKAFKMLGASYAIANQLGQSIEIAEEQFSFNAISARQSEYQNLKFATATDGNHGRAVAWCTKLFGCDAFVFMPKGSSIYRLEAIRKYAKEANITELNYDDTVAQVEDYSKKNDWILLQDTAWPGYEEIPSDIMRGYFTLIEEYLEQCQGDWPSHVFLQAGVGSMAAAIAAYFVIAPQPTPNLILVEPDKAPCFYQSAQINDGTPHRYRETMDTIMAGLACGEPSSIAWEILSKVCSAFIICKDQVALSGMHRYASPEAGDPAMVSGESGAVTLGLVERLMTDSAYQSARDALQLNGHSKVLLFSTEGDTDPDIYRSLLDASHTPL